MKSGKKLLAVMMAAMFAAGTVAGCGSTGTKATQADQTTAKEETSKVEETTKAAETTEAKAEKEALYVFIAASLKNTMETSYTMQTAPALFRPRSKKAPSVTFSFLQQPSRWMR